MTPASGLNLMETFLPELSGLVKDVDHGKEIAVELKRPFAFLTATETDLTH